MDARSSFVAAALSCVLLAACDEDPVGPREEQWSRPAILPTRPVASVSTTVVLSGSGSATIDGLIRPDEWSGAAVANFSLSTFGDDHPAKLYVMNDETYLYLGVVIENDDFAPVGNFQGDILNIYFDNNHNGGIAYSNSEGGDDFVQIPSYLGDAFLDGFNCQDPCTLPHNVQPDFYDGGSTDLFAVRTHSNPVEGAVGTYTYEMRKPLASGDVSHDFTLHEGDPVGLFLEFVDTPSGADAGSVSTWPGPDACAAFAFGYPPCEEATVLIASSVIAVSIDVKPGVSPNTINPRNNGNIPVAIVSTPSFDATTVDPASILLAVGATSSSPVKTSLTDIDGDGDMDLVAHFPTQASGITCSTTTATLSARTVTGKRIKGSDSVIPVGCS